MAEQFIVEFQSDIMPGRCECVTLIARKHYLVLVEEQVVEDRPNLGAQEWGNDWTPDPILTDGQMIKLCSTVRRGATHFRKANTCLP